MAIQQEQRCGAPDEILGGYATILRTEAAEILRCGGCDIRVNRVCLLGDLFQDLIAGLRPLSLHRVSVNRDQVGADGIDASDQAACSGDGDRLDAWRRDTCRRLCTV